MGRLILVWFGINFGCQPPLSPEKAVFSYAAKIRNYLDELFRILRRGQMPAVTKDDQLRIRHRISKLKSICERDVIVLVSPDQQRRLANQRGFALNPIRAPASRRANHRAMGV